MREGPRTRYGSSQVLRGPTGPRQQAGCPSGSSVAGGVSGGALGSGRGVRGGPRQHASQPSIGSKGTDY